MCFLYTVDSDVSGLLSTKGPERMPFGRRSHSVSLTLLLPYTTNVCILSIKDFWEKKENKHSFVGARVKRQIFGFACFCCIECILCE